MLLAIKSQLEGIATTAGYKTDVVTVEPWMRSREIPRGSLRPLLCFGFGPETYEHSASANMRAQVVWYVAGYVDTSSNEITDGWEDASILMNNLIDDVIVAILSTEEKHTLGGYATMTVLVDSVTSEPDPDRGDDGMILMTFKTIYHRNTSAS
jgi:hypothetical protein